MSGIVNTRAIATTITKVRSPSCIQRKLLSASSGIGRGRGNVPFTGIGRGRGPAAIPGFGRSSNDQFLPEEEAAGPGTAPGVSIQRNEPIRGTEYQDPAAHNVAYQKAHDSATPYRNASHWKQPELERQGTGPQDQHQPLGSPQPEASGYGGQGTVGTGQSGQSGFGPGLGTFTPSFYRPMGRGSPSRYIEMVKVSTPLDMSRAKPGITVEQFEDAPERTPRAASFGFGRGIPVQQGLPYQGTQKTPAPLSQRERLAVKSEEGSPKKTVEFVEPGQARAAVWNSFAAPLPSLQGGQEGSSTLGDDYNQRFTPTMQPGSPGSTQDRPIGTVPGFGRSSNDYSFSEQEVGGQFSSSKGAESNRGVAWSGPAAGRREGAWVTSPASSKQLGPDIDHGRTASPTINRGDAWSGPAAGSREGAWVTSPAASEQQGPDGGTASPTISTQYQDPTRYNVGTPYENATQWMQQGAGRQDTGPQYQYQPFERPQPGAGHGSQGTFETGQPGQSGFGAPSFNRPLGRGSPRPTGRGFPLGGMRPDWQNTFDRPGVGRGQQSGQQISPEIRGVPVEPVRVHDSGQMRASYYPDQHSTLSFDPQAGLPTGSDGGRGQPMSSENRGAFVENFIDPDVQQPGVSYYSDQNVQAFDPQYNPPDVGPRGGEVDYYSQTFRPVMQPDSEYTFGPERLSTESRGAFVEPVRDSEVDQTGTSYYSEKQSSGIFDPQFRPPEFGAHAEGADYYSQTFKPVMQPDSEYGSGPEGYPTGAGTGWGQPIFSESEGTSFEPARDHEIDQSALQRSRKEEGDEAIRILEERLMLRRRARMEEWGQNKGEDARYQRRSPVDVLQSSASQGSRESKAREPASNRSRRPQQQQRRQQQQRMGDEVAENVPKRELTEDDEKKLQQDLQNKDFRDSLVLLYDKFIYKSLHRLGSMLLEPEYVMGDFRKNPDIDETPLPSLEEHLEKAKPSFMKAGLIKSDGDWQELMSHVLKNAPIIEEFVEEFSGPGRYTAKEENEDLEEIASALPSDVGPKLQASTQRALTTLKYNPGMNLDEKQWLIANMVKEFSQYQYAQS